MSNPEPTADPLVVAASERLLEASASGVPCDPVRDLIGADDWDQGDGYLGELVHAWNSGVPDTPNWDVSAPWVGQTIRVQFGLHSTGTDDDTRTPLVVSRSSR